MNERTSGAPDDGADPAPTQNRNRALVTGLIALTLFVLAAVRQAQVSAATEVVEATVVGNVESTGRGSTHWCPTLRWSYGGQVRVTASTSCEREPYPVDSTVPLLVDPDDPDSYVIDAFAPRYTIQIVLAGLGVFFGLYALAYARRYRRDRWAATYDKADPPAPG